MINKKTIVKRIMALLLCCCMLVTGLQMSMTDVKAETGKYYLKVNKGTNVVTVYTYDNKPYTAFVASTGYATPVGTFYTQNKYRWWTLDGPSYGQYCTRITQGYLFHSVWYYQQNTTSQSYVQYNKLGTTASHGCCRLTTAAAKWIYDNCPVGTKVIIFNGSSNDDPLGKPEAIKVSTATSMGWDPTDPDSANPYTTKNSQPKIQVKSKRVKVQYNGKFSPVEMQAYDSAGKKISNAWIRTSGTVNTKKMGEYRVRYSLTDSFGRDTSVTVSYVVGDAKKPVITGVRSSLVREYRAVIKLRAGIRAKSGLGKSLTDKIIVKIRKPGEKTYHKTSLSSMKLLKTGTYRILYYVKNPLNGKAAQKVMSVTVKDTKKPVLASSDKFAPVTLKAGTKTVSYKKLASGVSAKLVSGKNMTSKISIKVTDPSGKVKTVARNGSYTVKKPGKYTITYYCMNPDKNLKSGKYMIAKRSRRMTVAEPETAAVSAQLVAPADETIVTTSGALNVKDGVSAVITESLTDGTERVSEQTDGISCKVTYQADDNAPTEDIALTDDAFAPLKTGVYKLIYSYTDAKGRLVRYVRTLTVVATP